MTATAFTRPGFRPAGRALGVDFLTRRAADRLLAVLIVGAWVQLWMREIAPIGALEAVFDAVWRLGWLGVALVCAAMGAVVGAAAALAGTRLGPFGASAAVAVPLAGASAATLGALLTSVVVGSAVLLALLLHEAAHVAVARRHGMRAEGVVITGFGAGAVITDDEFPSARAMVCVAAAGPAVNLLVAIVAWGVAQLLEARFPLGGAAAELVAGINLAAGFTNALPVPPLDGGWVLTGVLWSRHPAAGHAGAVRDAPRAGWRVLLVLSAVTVVVAASTRWPMAVAAAVLSVAVMPTVAFARWRIAAVERAAG